MAIVEKKVGKLPVYKGDWSATYNDGHGYMVKNRVTIFGSELESLIDNNTYVPATRNEQTGVVTFEEHWKVISNGSQAYAAALAATNKMAELEEEWDDQDQRMTQMQATINAKQLEVGAVQTDEVPTENSGNHMTSGDIYQTLKNSTKGFVDDKPTAESDNLVKSGGIMNELALGAVYDVSAKNPTAGPNNDGKWESLSALLSDANLNTLIPTAVRKGGMSIKFIQSSDNKYVQYMFLLSGSFTNAQFVNTSNWEKINIENFITKLLASKVSIGFTKAGGGRCIQNVTKSGSSVSVQFNSDAALCCNVDSDISRFAQVSLSTNEQTYTLANLHMLVANLSDGTLSVEELSAAQIYSINNSVSKVILIYNLWGCAFSPIASLQDELYQLQFTNAEIESKIEEVGQEISQLQAELDGNYADEHFTTETPSVTTDTVFDFPFKNGETYTIATAANSGYLRTFYLVDSNGNPINNSFKRDGEIQGVINSIPNSSEITIECLVDALKFHIRQRGEGEDSAADFRVFGGTGGIKNDVSTLKQQMASLSQKKVINVGSMRSYTGILAAIRANNEDNVVFMLDDEEFDIYAEYLSIYGNTFFSNYGTSDYNDTDDNLKKGLYLNNGCEIIGKSGTKILFNNTSGSSASMTYFSPVNLTMNNRVENIIISCGDRGFRYHIHDDFAGTTRGKNEIVNCSFYGQPKATGCIGGGMYHGCTYIVDGCLFGSSGYDNRFPDHLISMYYHNARSAGTKNKLIVRNCYCLTIGGIEAWKYGQSTSLQKTDVYFYNNHGNVLLTTHPDDTWANDNMEAYIWNNIPVNS